MRAVFLLFSLLAVPTSPDKGSFSYLLTSSAEEPLYGVRLETTVPAVSLALDYINSHSLLLPGINFTYGKVRSLECPLYGASLEDELNDANFAILGFSCRDVSRGQIQTEMFNITPVIHYTPTSAEVLFNNSYSSDQRASFGIHPSASTYTEVVISILEMFKWQRFLTVSSLKSERFFNDVLDRIRIVLQDSSITLLESELNSTGVFPDDVRVIFLNVNPPSASRIMCQAYRAGMLFPRYVWITYAGQYEDLVRGTSCSRDQMATFLEGVFTLFPTISNGLESDVTADWVFNDTINLLKRTEGFSTLSYFAFDAVLALAQAVNDTLAGWSNNSPDWSFCEVENEEKGSSLSKCFVRQKIQNIEIEGLTGEISFNSEGGRVINVIGLHQYRAGENGFPVSTLIATVTSNSNAAVSDFQLVNGENETTLFKGPIPPDGSPIKNINLQPLPLVILYYILSSLGLLFAFACLLFNILFRRRKIVKLISPNLNYFVVTGAIMLYSQAYLRIYPSDSLLFLNIKCNLQIFLTCVGYVLCFAPVLMKMWRVYYIFHNPSPTKKAVKDWHLVLGTSITVGIITIAVLIGYVPGLRGIPSLLQDVERPNGITEDGIRIENCVYQCYGFTASLAWIGLEYLYLLSLQAVAFVLAILTRKVKIKVLNDSREMIIIVYTSTSIMIVLGLITFALSTRFILIEVLYNGGVMLATTVFLTFLFVPKMVDLYKDPRGEGIFGRATSTNNTTTANAGHYKSGISQTTHTLVESSKS